MSSHKEEKKSINSTKENRFTKDFSFVQIGILSMRKKERKKVLLIFPVKNIYIKKRILLKTEDKKKNDMGCRSIFD